MKLRCSECFIDTQLASAYPKVLNDLEVIFNNDIEDIVRMPVLEALKRSPAFEESIPRLLSADVYDIVKEDGQDNLVINMDLSNLLNNVLYLKTVDKTEALGCIRFYTAQSLKPNAYLVLHAIHKLKKTLHQLDITRLVLAKTAGLTFDQVGDSLVELNHSNLIRVKQGVVQITEQVRRYNV